RYDVEGIAGVAAMGSRVGERADDLLELRDRARPAVSDDERERRWAGAPRVDEMDAEPADGGAEVRKPVQTRLGGAPVVAVAPVGDQLPHVGELRSVVPARAGDLVGEARARQALAQIRENGV